MTLPEIAWTILGSGTMGAFVGFLLACIAIFLVETLT